MLGAGPAGGSGGEGRDDEVVSAVLHPGRPRRVRGLFFVRPAGRTYLEVKVLYTLGKEKC
jgi:hypothetical protein